MSDELDCTFCVELENVEKSEFRSFFTQTELKSRVIHNTQNFICLAALGAIRPGYILLLPKKHLFSFAFLDPSLAQEAEQLKSKLSNKIRKLFSDFIIFEHGVINSEATGGGCIDHAHLHFFPSNVDLFGYLSSEFTYLPIEHIRDLNVFCAKQQPYLYYEKNGYAYAFLVNKTIPSQFLRRIIMEREGMEGQWDWSVYPGKNDVIKTVQLFKNPDEG